MHRTITVSLPSDISQKLCDGLISLEKVVGLSIVRGAAVKPLGDTITIDVLNRGADEVLKIVRAIAGDREFSIVTAEATSFIDPTHQETIESDKDEAVWEEMESGLRHQGHITPNFIYLMALGGVIAAIGLVSEPAPQALTFAAASIIAPGFEPLAKIPLGVVLGRWNVVARGALASLAGYAVLILSAALVMWILFATESVEFKELADNPEVKNIAAPKLKEMIVSAAAALAGVVMIAAYRRSVIAGPLIAIVIIPAAALVGAGLAAQSERLVYEGFERLGLDVLFIIGAGIIVFAGKQWFLHQREPLV